MSSETFYVVYDDGHCVQYLSYEDIIYECLLCGGTAVWYNGRIWLYQYIPKCPVHKVK